MVKEQEEMIDDLSSGVKRLNEMAHTIQDEIQQHDQLIDNVEIEVDVAQTRIERGRKEIERFLKTRSALLCVCVSCRLVSDQDDFVFVSLYGLLRVVYVSLLVILCFIFNIIHSLLSLFVKQTRQRTTTTWSLPALSPPHLPIDHYRSSLPHRLLLPG